VEYGTGAALGQRAHDDLDEGVVSQVHQVTLTRLEPETTYHFRIHSGETVDDNRGALYEVTTKKTGMPQIPFLAYGQVETSDGALAVGALVRARLVDTEGTPSEPLSALVDGYGYWSLSLPLPSCEGVQLKLQAIGQRGSETEVTQSACKVRPVPTVVLAEESPERAYLPLIVR
jgi:hypothetical protein